MLGFVAPRLVLLSVPKTGTTALEEALTPHAQLVLRARPEIKHLALRQYNNNISPLLKTIPGPPFRTVAMIRDPLSWLSSWYRYRQRPSRAGHPNSTIGITFDQFVRDYLSTGQRPRYAALGRQSWFLTPRDGQPPLDLLFRYEAMDALVGFFEQSLDTTLTLPQLNVSPKSNVKLSGETYNLLRDVLADDYSLWESALVEAP